jgi:hypothetical protein
LSVQGEKGIFMGGNIAYVMRDDLAMCAAAFRRQMPEPVPLAARRILDLLERQGPMYKSELQELTGFERGRFNRVLCTLNRAFQVMQIQRTLDWDSPWDLYRRAYSDADLFAWEQAGAQAEVLLRFTKAFGPATIVEMGDWSGWDQRTITKLLDGLLQDGAVVGVDVEGHSERAYIANDDVRALEGVEPITSFLIVLPASDPLVLPQWSWVKARYRFESLPYCLGVIVDDGEIAGAAWGHYKRR